MFCGCRSLTSLDLSCFDTSKVTNMEYLFINCISLKYLNVSSFKTSNVENMKGMFQNCTSLTSLNLSNFDTSKVTIFNSMFEDSEKLKIIDFKNAVINNNAYTENAFKNLSSGVKICIDEESLLLKSVTSSLNCFFYISCDDKEYDVPGKFIDQLDNNICTYNCTNLRKYFIESDNICYKPTQDTNLPYIKNISEICDIINFFKKICVKILITEEEKYYFKMDIVNSIQNGSLYELIYEVVENENCLIIKNDKEIYQISTLIDQVKLENLTFIDLKDCENKIRDEYKIEDEILIFKIEHYKIGYNIPIIEYVLFLENGTLINLNICNNFNSKHLIPVSINKDNLYQYDPSNDYYKDECMKLKSEEGIDLTLYDRKNNYNEKNMSLCEINCTLKYYDSNTSKVICDCKIKSNLLTYNDLTENNLLNKIDNSESKTNLNIMKCYNSISSEDIKTNSGFYVIFIVIVLFIIIMIIFCCKGYDKLENKIDEVIYKKFKNKKIVKVDKIKTNNKINIRKNKRITDRSKSKNNLMSNISNKIENSNEIISMLTTPGNNEIKYDNDYELNNLSIILAIKYDKREFCEYYCSLIKMKQIIYFSFCDFNDYNSGIIKKFIFFLSFALHYTINALFFTFLQLYQLVFLE